MSEAEILVVVSDADSDDKTLTASCAHGKIAIAGGARLLGAESAEAGDIPAGVAIVGSYPSGLTGEKPAGWTAIANEVSENVSDSWRLSVHAICARMAD